MKKALLICMMLVLANVARSGDSRLVNEDMGKCINEQIKSKNVMSITGYTFAFVNGVLAKESYKSSVEMFDKRGLKTEDAVYSPSGEAEFSFLYGYNEEGIQLKSVGITHHKPTYNFWSYELIDSISAIKKYHSDTRKKEYWLSVYDKKGRKVKEEYFNGEGFKEWTKEFVYNNDGLLMERKESDGYGNVYSRVTYAYNDKGQNIERVNYSSQDIVFSSCVLSYDEKGNIKTLTQRDHEGNDISMTVYSYAYF